MSNVTDEQKMHHYMGIEMNIQTWNLLGKENRNEQDNVRMINYSKASLYHWRKSHKYESVNEQRGQWMLSRVYAVLGKGKEALSYAEETSRLTKEQDLKDFVFLRNLNAKNSFILRKYRLSQSHTPQLI